MSGKIIAYQKETIVRMIQLYCKCHHKAEKGKLCNDCAQLLTYAHARLDTCKFGDDKPACKNCPVHCYKPVMREKVKLVMRFSGPRMLWHYPLASIRHLFKP